MTADPALAALLAGIETELVFAQALIRRAGNGFGLRHVADGSLDSAALRLIAETEIRPLAQFTERGAFRPLKSAPNLRRGWLAALRDDKALGAALNQLYPGAVADWFAGQKNPPPVTSYREFTNRQTGMYRITARLDDADAGAVARACCHANSCLKRRLWTVDGLAPDAAASKSIIPCLEPCAVLLEFARKMARMGQEHAASPAPGREEMARRRAEAAAALERPDAVVEECDFDSPLNPRRARFVLEKLSQSDTPSAG